MTYIYQEKADANVLQQIDINGKLEDEEDGVTTFSVADKTEINHSKYLFRLANRNRWT